MQNVFIVQHSYDLEGCDETKFIGVYATEQDALNAVARLKQKPGFIERPEDFEVTEYEINKDHWCDGYFTATIGED